MNYYGLSTTQTVKEPTEKFELLIDVVFEKFV